MPLAIVRAVAVILLIATVLAGFVGDPDPLRNLAPVMVWVVWWVGVACVCALIGDLWALVNPFRTLFCWAEWIFERLTAGDQLSLARPYPHALAMWPAVVGRLIFFWAELIWSGGSVPRNLAIAILIYAVVTWGGMFVYGRDVWLQNGDTFSVVFGILARFAPLELRVVDNTAVVSTCAAAMESTPPCAGVVERSAGHILHDGPLHHGQPVDSGTADGRLRSRLIDSLPKNGGISAVRNGLAFRGRIYYGLVNLIVSNGIYE